MHKYNVIAQNVYTKCAKLVDEKNNRLFCCVNDLDFEPKILIKGVHLTNKKKFRQKVDFFLMKKGIHVIIQKSKNKYVTVLLFYSIFKIFKPEIQNGLPKITKIKRIC